MKQKAFKDFLLFQKYSSEIVLFLVFGLISFCWYFFVFANPLTIWGVPEDAPIMSLAQAINIDFWFSQPGGRGISQAQFYQPGLLFQIFSWLAYRVSATTPFVSAIELFRTHAMEPQRFWIAIQSLAFLISILSVFVVWLKVKSRRAIVVATATLIYFTCNPAVHYGVYMFWNESFTLLLAILFFTFAGSILGAEKEITSKEIIKLGIFAGFLYMHKLNYVVWGAAFIPAFLIKYYFEKRTLKKLVMHSTLYVASLATSVLVLGRLLLGDSGFKEMILAHKEIFLRSGVYGNGSQNVVSTEAVMNGLQSLIHSDPFVVLFCGLIVPFVGFYVLQNWKNKEWRNKFVPEAVLLVGALTLTTMAILKHYQAHYTVAIAALFPLFVIWLDKLEKKFLLYLFLPFIFLAINYNFKARRNYNQQIVKNQQEAAMDEAEILKMPLDPGQKRYWMYRVVVPSFQRLFALDFAAARWLQNEVVKIQGEQWLTSPWQNMVWTADGLKAMSDTNWQYIVVANDTVEWVSTEMHPWLKDSRTKVLSLRQMKVFENPNFIESGSIQVKEISKDEH